MTFEDKKEYFYRSYSKKTVEENFSFMNKDNHYKYSETPTWRPIADFIL